MNFYFKGDLLVRANQYFSYFARKNKFILNSAKNYFCAISSISEWLKIYQNKDVYYI